MVVTFMLQTPYAEVVYQSFQQDEMALRISFDEALKNRIMEKIRLPRGIYLHLCPNCGGAIEDNRLLFRNLCSKCMNVDTIVKIGDVAEVVKYVKELKTEGGIKKVIDIRKFVDEFDKFFTKCVGGRPWNLQISWVIRLAQNQSFALIAPTGVGKTTFGLVMALYLSYKFGKKTYIIVPTTILVKLYEEKIREYMEKANIVVQITAIHSRLSPKKRLELENVVREGSFDILITTSKYLQKNFNTVFTNFMSKGNRIDFLFVDDVDAIMKGSKAIDMVLKLIGFDDKDIEDGYKLISIRQKLPRCEGISEGKEKEVCYEDGRHIYDVFEELQRKILAKRAQCGVLIISSATGRARGRRVRLFRELLGFNIGSAVEIYRNVVDTYMVMPKKEEDVVDLLTNLIKMLGDGGLVYVPIDRGLEYAYKLRDMLKDKGVEAEVLSSKQPHILEKFVMGELKVLIGVATYYGLLVRGIDIPERIRYAIFVGVPRHKISISYIGYNPQNLLRLLIILSDVVQDNVRKETIIRLITKLRRIIRRTSAEKLKVVTEKLSSGETLEDPVALTIAEAHKYVISLLSEEPIVEALKKYPKISIVEEHGSLYVLIPDSPTYIQASGRTSRLFIGGITTGLSIVLVDDERLANGLVDRARFYIEDFTLTPLESVDLKTVIKRIDEDRELVKQIKTSKVIVEDVAKALKVKTVLFIVESPNKARTIASFFGRPTYRDIDGLRVYETNVGELHLIITSTGGHVFELVEEELQEDSVYGIAMIKLSGKPLFLPKYDYIKRCLSCGTQFVKDDRCPVCKSSRYRSSRSIIEVLQRIALEVDEVVIATDPDAEGEKIGYDVAIAIAPFAKSIVRAEFHEVTRKAVLNSFRNPRGFDLLLVEAQIARRIEDRWLGFALSEYVTDKLKSLGLALWDREGRLSAGRVQTPVLGRVIELYVNRLRTLRKSKLLYLNGLTIEVPQELLEEVLGEDVKRLSPSRVEVTFIPLSKRIEIINPLPPFSTDEMIAEAHRLLKLDAVETMRLAQDLFELGFITYHRTDSTRISSAGIGIAKEYLTSVYGDKYVHLFEPRTWGTGGAHEGIRPTKPVDVGKLRELIAEGIIEIPIRLSANHFRLYDLIFRRFIASQMKPGVIEKQQYLAVVKVDGKEVVRQMVEVAINILEPGFMSVYASTKIISLPSTEFTLRPSKVVTVTLSSYSMPLQGDIIRWMKDVGIGRPSTYAKIIDTIIRRGYVISSRGGVLIPSTEGVYVYTLLAGTSFSEGVLSIDDFLIILGQTYKKKEHMIDNIKRILSIVRDDVKKMVSIIRTRELYQKIQAIEEGKADYVEVVYELFREVCAHILSEMSKGIDLCRKIQM